jgi:predicted nuclease with TOPRIM domain
MENANSGLTLLAREFRGLKDRKEALEAELKKLNEDIKKIEVERLPAMMDQNDVEKFTVEGVGTIFQQVKVYAHVKKEDEARFHEWLRETGNADLIKAYVFPQTLASFAKEQLEQGTDLPDFLTAHKVPTAMLRRK